MVSLNILGATGSIGCSALQIIEQIGEDYEIISLTAGSDGQALLKLAAQFKPQFIALADTKHQQKFTDQAKQLGVESACGHQALIEAAERTADITLIAISGIAALKPSLAAIKNSKTIAIANKECLVSAGQLITQTARQHQCQLIPVDSEHNALFQILNPNANDNKHITKIILTASGGPFLTLPKEQFSTITPEQALKHPNWSMGKKNSIDSATMMNKALEIIEAHHLFAIPNDSIDVVIHPQSLVHALVQYHDHSLIAHLSPTDMKVPIAYALSYPKRMQLKSIIKQLDLTDVKNLQFSQPDEHKFPALKLARDALKQGNESANILNAANEIAVEAFLNTQINFNQITQITDHCLQNLTPQHLNNPLDIDNILHIDKQTRQIANQFINQLN